MYAAQFGGAQLGDNEKAETRNIPVPASCLGKMLFILQ